jgi:beta-lactam-binding protein with PASTA domain
VFSTPIISSTILPDAVGFGLQGNTVTAWLSFSGVWQQVTAIGSVNVGGSYDFTAPGALTGWNPGTYWETAISASTPIAVAEIAYYQPFASPVVTTVPNVVGETQAQATTDIEAASLVVGNVTFAFSSMVPVGDVISQNPAAGTSVAGGSAVDLVISSNSIVPSVINLSLPVATATLVAAGFIVGAVGSAPSGTIISGNVTIQAPAAGSSFPPGTAINLTLSSGLPALLVPDIFGLTQENATNLLLSLGLVVGAVGSAPSNILPSGEVQTQNPSAGTPVAAGSIVSFVLSLGTPAVGTMFDFEATVISQYANSPTIMQLVQNLNQYIDQSANFANFFNFVWNVDTAVGFGLDIWGTIVGVSRLLQIPNSTEYVGFYIAGESQPLQDWTPAGSSAAPYNKPPVGGAFYTGHNATEAYLLPDDSYRQLILAKAFANICTTTAPAINQILQNLYGPGTAWVLNTGPMSISYNLSFTPTAIQLAILEQSGVIPTPPGVSVVINTNV